MQRHSIDSLSLAGGVLLGAMGAALLSGAVPVADVRWVAPLVVAALGLWLIVSARTRATAAAGDDEPEPAEGAEAADPG